MFSVLVGIISIKYFLKKLIKNEEKKIKKQEKENPFEKKLCFPLGLTYQRNRTKNEQYRMSKSKQTLSKSIHLNMFGFPIRFIPSRFVKSCSTPFVWEIRHDSQSLFLNFDVP